jgi:hypothetical protein
MDLEGGSRRQARWRRARAPTGTQPLPPPDRASRTTPADPPRHQGRPGAEESRHDKVERRSENLITEVRRGRGALDSDRRSSKERLHHKPALDLAGNPKLHLHKLIGKPPGNYSYPRKNYSGASPPPPPAGIAAGGARDRAGLLGSFSGYCSREREGGEGKVTSI